MKLSHVTAVLSLSLTALVSAQTAPICATLESNIDAELRAVALATALPAGDSAPSATM